MEHESKVRSLKDSLRHIKDIPEGSDVVDWASNNCDLLNFSLKVPKDCS